MGRYRVHYTQTATHGEYWLPKRSFRKFGISLLGLGDISRNGKCFEALAAIFDLKEFTSFCDQRDPHLEVPEYLQKFLNWLIERISADSVQREDKDRMVLWYHLPIFGKFLGDGVLLLWDAEDLSHEEKGDIVSDLYVICNDYEKVFLRETGRKFTQPPPRLRCGIAQGQVTSIGAENDFVGLCINIASRLQKLHQGSFSFAFTQKGLAQEADEDWYKDFCLVKMLIRGVGKKESVYVLRKEFNALPKSEREDISL